MLSSSPGRSTRVSLDRSGLVASEEAPEGPIYKSGPEIHRPGLRIYRLPAGFGSIRPPNLTGRIDLPHPWPRCSPYRFKTLTGPSPDAAQAGRSDPNAHTLRPGTLIGQPIKYTWIPLGVPASSRVFPGLGCTGEPFWRTFWYFCVTALGGHSRAR